MNIKLIFTVFISSGFLYNSHDLLSHNHTQNPFINSAKYLFWHIQSLKYRCCRGIFHEKIHQWVLGSNDNNNHILSIFYSHKLSQIFPWVEVRSKRWGCGGEISDKCEDDEWMLSRDQQPAWHEVTILNILANNAIHHSKE